MDFQPVLSHYAVLKYIAKYTSKEEGKSETYHHMLTRIIAASCPQDPASYAYHRLHLEAIVDRDISAQETCHMLQKLPLVTCNRSFIKLNVGRHIFRRISPDSSDCLSGSSFIDAYLQRLPTLDHFFLINLAQQWSYNHACIRGKWKKRTVPAIFHVW